MEITGTVNVRLICSKCKESEFLHGLDIKANSWEEFEIKATYPAFDGWTRIESRGLIRFECPKCSK